MAASAPSTTTWEEVRSLMGQLEQLCAASSPSSSSSSSSAAGAGAGASASSVSADAAAVRQLAASRVQLPPRSLTHSWLSSLHCYLLQKHVSA